MLPNIFKFFKNIKIYLDPGDRCGAGDARGGAGGNGRDATGGGGGAIGCIEGDGGGGGGCNESNGRGAPGGIVGAGGNVGIGCDGEDGEDGEEGGFNSDGLRGRIGRGVMVGRASSLMLIDIFCFCESRSL